MLLVVGLGIPAALAIAGALSDILHGTRYFGSNPVKEIEHFLGRWTLRLIVATLCVTPLRQLTGWNWLAKHRRTVGLFAFAYVTLHWIAYAFLDVQLDWGELTKDLLKRPYIYLGMTALVCLTALAVTSTKGMIRRMGGRNWNRLHALIYPAAILGVIHYAMAQKKDISEPLDYAALLTVLLGWRLWRWARRRAGAPAAA
ncbi:MAG TPA: protein-methionine-sulfoxide reductase heme-binding subunit MsrQ [Gemmatimonadaceae bacterium]|nr:protein-methionine-sulfoxide reductase heme-binding subunit MsrQ [Gemmatimonadaceae bacterium]